MRHENCYRGYGSKYSMRPEIWPPHLHTVSDRLLSAQLMSLDFEGMIVALPVGCFALVDPPYGNADQQKFYNGTFDVSDHNRLAASLRRNSKRLLFLLTYDDRPEVRKNCEWVSEVRNRAWNYPINRTDEQCKCLKLKDGFTRSRGKGRELFIRNYHVQGKGIIYLATQTRVKSRRDGVTVRRTYRD